MLAVIVSIPGGLSLRETRLANRIMAAQNTAAYHTFQLQLRTYHFAKPHTHKVMGCPECYDKVEEFKNDIAVSLNYKGK